MAEDSRKRRKLNPLPDGFVTSKKPQQRIHAPKFQSAFDAPSSSSSSSKPKIKAPKFPPRPPPAQQKLSNDGQETKRSTPSLRVQPIPNPPVPAPAPAPQPTKTTIPMKRHEPPVIPPIHTTSRPTTSTKPLSAASYFLKEQSAAPAAPAKPLQRRAPPVLEQPSAAETKELKPLSTSHFASLSDASLDDYDSSIDLSSILLRLQEHKAGIHPNERSDVLISPQKNKHIRGGLAAHAAQLFKKTHTSLYLWRTSLESQPLQQTSSDLTFRISKVVHTTFTGTSKPSLSITLCRILTPVRPFTSRKQRIYILLKLPDASKPSLLCDPNSIRAGTTLRIWRPWHEIPLIQYPPDSIPEIPNASLPLPSSNDSSSIPYDENIHNTVLLSSRFSITQDLT